MVLALWNWSLVFKEDLNLMNLVGFLGLTNFEDEIVLSLV